MTLIKFFILSIIYLLPTYIFAQNEVYVSTYNALYLVDISTCNSQLIDYTVPTLYDIALNPVDGALYGGDQNKNLYRIDKTTGATTLIANKGGGYALTFSKDGTLYSLLGSWLHRIDLTTGDPTYVMGSVNVNSPASGDIALLNDKFYYPSKTFPVELIEIDFLNPVPYNMTNRGVYKTIGTFPPWIEDMYGIASIGCEPELYGFTEDMIVKIPFSDPSNTSIHCPNIVAGNITGVAAISEDINFDNLDLGTTIHLCEDDILELDVTIPNASYLWQDNSTASTYTISDAGTYMVTVSIDNCIKEDVVDVEVTGCDCFKGFPDIFTPNQDGINDYFGPVEKCDVETVEFKIFNRWGQLIYQTTGINSPAWDGTFKGVDCANDVYVYVFKYMNNLDVQESVRGTITLMR